MTNKNEFAETIARLMVENERLPFCECPICNLPIFKTKTYDIGNQTIYHRVWNQNNREYYTVQVEYRSLPDELVEKTRDPGHNFLYYCSVCEKWVDHIAPVCWK